MDILVGLWSRDTTTILGENQGTRLYWLKEAVKATQAKRAEQAAQFADAGAIETIFVAPEYLFSAERRNETDARAISDVSRAALKKLLAELSSHYEKMLIVPGTIIYKVDLKQFPIHGAAKKLKTVGVLATAATSEAKNPVFGQVSAQEKNQLIKQGDAVSKLVKNKMYVFFGGEVVASYGKRADMLEAIGDDADQGIFVPGLKASMQAVGGITFAFEICFDHYKGVLKAVMGKTGSVADIQIICSAHVDNTNSNMMVRPGGFVLHASSKHECSGVFYKTNPAPPLAGARPALVKPVPTIKPTGDVKTAGVIDKLGEQLIGGSPLAYYRIRYA